jgi:hypothetical protein
MRAFKSLTKLDIEMAYLLEGAPDDESRETGSLLDMETLSSFWVHHSQIEEFALVAAKVPMANARVLRATGAFGECGYAYRQDEYSKLNRIFLVSLDEEALPPHLSLPEALLHELAHLYSVAGPHDWSFLLALNLMRIECGYKLTEDAADCSDLAYWYQKVSVNEILRRAAEDATELRDQWGHSDAIECVTSIICPFEDGE